MDIDLTKIFEEQAELDKKIHEKHHVSYRTVNRELKLALIVELAELANEIRSFKFWSTKKQMNRKAVLEEYADCIHFITSLCLLHKVSPKFSAKRFLNKYEESDKKMITRAFIWLNRKACNINQPYKARSFYMNFLKFGFRLGFSMQEILDAYEAKNKINIQRQEENY